MIEMISREAENQIPDFKDHHEAYEWFEGKYGDNFVLSGKELIDGRMIYFYRLLLKPEVYFAEMEKLSTLGHTTGFDFIDSYQSIEIWEDGRIHIIH